MSASTPGTIDALSAAQFEERLRHAGRFGARSPIPHPLAAALSAVERSPACAQSRLLTRLLDALTYERGDFRHADVSALDATALALAIALMDGKAAGAWRREEWVRVTDSAKDAEVRA